MVTSRQASAIRTALLLMVSGIALCASSAQAGPIFTDPSVRLWYNKTGTFSDNILAQESFALWNTIIGGGDAEGDADDVLFSVTLRKDSPDYIAGPLILTARDQKGKVLATRKLTPMINGTAEKVVVPLMVHEIGCAGPVTFTARLGKVQHVTQLDFKCGE